MRVAIAAPLAAHLLLTSEPLLILTLYALSFYLAMLSGFLIVPPCRNAAGVTRKPKVFCIGLSRTGTTSITVALHQLGYDAHHQCHALVTHDSAGRPRMSRDWAEAFDVHSDIAPATVFEELAVAYPDARFVLTRREPRIWARVMIRFMGKFRHLFALPHRTHVCRCLWTDVALIH